MGAVAAICTAVAAVVGPLDGLNLITTQPPDVIAAFEFPAAVVYPGRQQWKAWVEDRGDGFATRAGLVTIFVDVHAARFEMPTPTAVATAMPFCDSVPLAIFVGVRLDHLGGTIVALGDPENPDSYAIRSEFAAFQWGPTETIGVRTEVDVWVEEEISL